MEEYIARSDVVISLVPQTLHVPVAKACIKYGKNCVTASYLSPEMKNLHEKAQQAGITIVNEQGLDPGLDHMSALKMIREVKKISNVFVFF